MRYLTADEVLRLARAELQTDALADRFLLDAAVERPQQSAGGVDAYPDVHAKAAALLHSLATNHAFVDGNKRVALLSTIGFYGLNGYVLDGGDLDVLHFVVDVATGTFDSVGLMAEHLQKWVFEIPDEEDEGITGGTP